MSHGMRKAAPPFWAAIRGNRHKLPAPIAMPNPARIRPHLDVKVSRPVMARQCIPREQLLDTMRIKI